MGLSDDSDETKPVEANPVADFAHNRSQPFDDTQIISPPQPPDDKAKFGDAHEMVQDTMPFDDTVAVEDAEFETQLLNLASETQVLDFGGETEVLDFGGETQVLDDINCNANMETQLLEFEDKVVGDTDSEESDTTKVLDDNEDLTDDESVRRDSGQFGNEEKIHCTHCENSEKGLMEQATNSTSEQHNAETPVDEGSPELKPGSVRMHFTSVHAASLWASGLSARTTALKSANTETHSDPSNNQSLEQLSGKDNAVSLLWGSSMHGEEVSQEHDLGRYDEEKIRRSKNEDNCRTGSSTARNFLTEDSDAENRGFPPYRNSCEEGEDLLQLPSCNLAGLSYIDSQEPGELSQANALDFVDKFLQFNVVEFDKEVDHGKSAGENSKFVSSAKGQQILAKKAIDKSIFQETGIFDWDVNREDEEGGDFFRRRKTDIFGSGSRGWRSLPQGQKSKGNGQEEQKDHEKQLQGKNKKMGAIHSDSKLLSYNSKFDKKIAHGNEIKYIKNLVCEFDEQLDTDSPRGHLDANVNKNNEPEMLDVGIDTQMAAEGIEALYNGEGISNCDTSIAHRDDQENPQSSPEGSMGQKTKKRISLKKPSSQKRARLSDAGVASRESRQAKKTRIGAKSGKHSVSSQEYSKKARKRCGPELVITKSNKAKSNAKKHLNINANKSSEKIPSVATDLRAEGSERDHLRLGDGNFARIARRTRQSMVVNRINKADNVPCDCGEESSYKTENFAIRQKLTGFQRSEVLSAKSSKSGFHQSGEVGNIKPSRQEGSDLRFEAVSIGINLDVVSFPKRRRSLRNMSGQVYVTNDLDGPSEQSVQPDKVGQRVTWQKRLQGVAESMYDHIKLTRRRTRSSTLGDQNLDGLFAWGSLKGGPREAHLHCNSSPKDERIILKITTGEKELGVRDRKSDSSPSSTAKMKDESRRENCIPSDSACATPVNSKVPTSAASPVCMGNEYFQCVTRQKRLQGGSESMYDHIKLTRRRTRSSTHGDQNLDGLFAWGSLKGGPREAHLHCNSSRKDERMISKITTGEKALGVRDRKSDSSPSSTAKMKDDSLRENCIPSDSACTTPVNSKVPTRAASPVCMGNEYFQQSCKRSLSRPSLLKEIRGLSENGHEPTSTPKDLRKRRDMTEVRVLYSHHLDEDIIKKQKKILALLRVSVAPSMTDATHFIADQFVRTRNMLEAIASGKPVVTHLWLQSCGQAGCFIHEKSYILRDTKKEKEFGFNMPASLAQACQHPLLEGRKVFITPNTKPSKEIISNLVRAVRGQAVERIGRSSLKDDNVPEDLLVLSCEEDYEICVPLLKKGASVYSSELLLNGIVTQRLEFERHRLFTDQVKKTRSTIWLRKDGNKFLPVTKNN